MQHPELKKIRNLALEIATSTYNISSWDLLTTEQRKNLKDIPYEQLLFLVDQKQHESYNMTEEEENTLRSNYKHIIEELTESDGDFESFLKEVFNMVQHGHYSNMGKPYTVDTLLSSLNELFENTLSDLKRKHLPYDIVKTGGWELEIDVRLQTVNIRFNIYDSDI